MFTWFTFEWDEFMVPGQCLLAGFDTSFDDAFAPPPAQTAASEWNPAPLAKGGSFNPDDPFA